MSHLIKYVETSLSGIAHDNARLFQEEIGDFASIWFSTGAELDLKVLPLMDGNASVNQHHETYSLIMCAVTSRVKSGHINATP